ncbi:50S ribosomal protein L11 methyltransferase [Shimazuella sp. AN120528]|uniref:50S ribosomal protein L11 methyltransferase n=1 Tax=Shimazuella soli TaxID=1892854 RepID=UPI001F11079D|nr:50S ribosomal protein L11 methyltransferase [Shimazuella soli]MCH5583849.1 50S ribosomal protein L11 methyltransferase [Shimazuella soli]
MKWLELAIYTEEESVEALTERLQDMGAGGVSIEESSTIAQTQPGEYGEIIALNPADYPDSGVIVKSYFAEVRNTDQLVSQMKECLCELKEYGLRVGESKIETKWVDDEDWANAWKAYYKPTRVSDRLVIVPVWEEYKIHSDELPIYLDPGMAFGTGTHPTTRLTLQLMEKYLHLGQKVIDVGCGSGILSIAAEKLGASEVLALDLDPVAVKNAQENCEQNDTKRIVVKAGNLLQGVGTTAQVIVANILAEILQQMMYDLPRVLEPGGIFIGSGIIESKQEDIVKGLQSVGLSVLEIITEEDWVAVAAKKA